MPTTNPDLLPLKRRGGECVAMSPGSAVAAGGSYEIIPSRKKHGSGSHPMLSDGDHDRSSGSLCLQIGS